MSSFQLEPTVVSVDPFWAHEDANTIRNAMTKGVGSKEGTVVEMFTKRSFEQRKRIVDAYNHDTKRDLKKDLKAELGGNFENSVLALLKPQANYLAKELHTAMHGPGTKENVLTTIICTYSNEDLKNIKHAYQKKYEKSLEEVVLNEVSGDYKKLLKNILRDSRNENLLSQEEAKEMAKRLYDAGEKKLGTDENTFIEIFSKSSFEQIKLISKEYTNFSKNNLQAALKKEFSGDILQGLLAIVKCAENRFRYFAEQLEVAMAGRGTRDVDLVRIIVSRCEIDLGGIKREYKNLYNRTLYNAVQSETTGDYKACLLSLIGHIN